MLIKGGSLFVGDGFNEGVIETEGERIVSVSLEDGGQGRADVSPSDVIDATGCYVIPGLIDLHFHGAVGHDLCDATPDGLSAIAAYEARRGVTAICPATMTFPMEVLEPVAKNVRDFAAKDNEAALVGINMEGPYISPGKVGAQNPQYVRAADLGELERLQELSGGLMKLVDVAPEEADNLSFIKEASKSVRISIAHTATDYDCAARAFEAGARQMTHLYNAMPGLHHRNPGPIAAAAERDDVMAEIIADGVHIHPAMVRLAFNLFGDERMILISDTLRAVGLGDGVHDLGGQDVEVKGKYATLMRTGDLAGSVCDLATCLNTAIREMEIPAVSAIKAATANPARALGIYEERGSLEPGKMADIVILDKDFMVKHVILRGKMLAAL